MSLSFAANIVFAVLLYTYAIAIVLAWCASRRMSGQPRRSGRARLVALDHQTRPATTVTFFLAVMVVLGALVGEQF